MMYRDTAEFYDRMTSDIDYKAYAGYFNDILDRHMESPPHSIMDLGCGTGNLTLSLAERGYDMTGIDSSPEMLSRAYVKGGPGVLWINQDFCSLDLFGTYDAAVSLLDCVNHIADENLLIKYFKLVYNYLNPGGMFIFDVNTEYKFSNVYASNVFYAIEDDFAYIWHNHYDKSEKKCRMDMTLFVKDGGCYKRTDAVNHEKVYSVEYLSGILGSAGFIIKGIYNDLTFEDPSEQSERIFFACRKET